MKIGEIEKVGERLPEVVVPPFDPSRRDAPQPAPSAPAPAEPAKEKEKEDA